MQIGLQRGEVGKAWKQHLASGCLFATMERFFLSVHDQNRNLVKTLGDLAVNTFDRMGGLVKEGGSPRAKRAIAKLQEDLFFQFSRSITEFKEISLTHQKDMMEQAVRSLTSRLEEYGKELPLKFY